MEFTLYKLNFKSGKSYIGQTLKTIEHRLRQHRNAARRGSPLWVHRAWRDFGDPQVQTLGNYNSQNELNEAEIKAIVEHNTMTPNGYNISAGGDNAPSKNPIVAKKISNLAKGRKHSEDTKKKLSLLIKKRWNDPEYRKKVKAGLKRAWSSKMRKKRSIWAKQMNRERIESGWKMPETALEKMRGRKVSEETRKRMSLSAKKRIRSPYSKKRCEEISERVKKDWKNSELRENRINSIKKAWTDERRKSFSDEIKKKYALGLRKKRT